MEVSDAGLKLIASFEGFSPVLYDDPVGHATIGYGFLVHLGPYHRTPGIDPQCDRWRGGLTPEQGRALLRDTVKAYDNAVERYTKVPLAQGQFDALSSFCYNVGQGGYLYSTVLQVLNQGRYDLVCGELKKYVRGTDGVVYPGLVRRREAECQLFHSNIPLAGEADVFVRLNGTAGVFANKTYNIGKDYFMALWTDFPSLPHDAKLVELDIRVDYTVNNSDGVLVLRDGSKAYADSINKSKPESIIRVIPNTSDGLIYFDVLNRPIKFVVVGIVGFWK